jgi:hypothetical protein
MHIYVQAYTVELQANWTIMVGHHPVITAGTHKHELLLADQANHPYSYVADCKSRGNRLGISIGLG